MGNRHNFGDVGDMKIADREFENEERFNAILSLKTLSQLDRIEELGDWSDYGLNTLIMRLEGQSFAEIAKWRDVGPSTIRLKYQQMLRKLRMSISRMRGEFNYTGPVIELWEDPRCTNFNKRIIQIYIKSLRSIKPCEVKP